MHAVRLSGVSRHYRSGDEVVTVLDAVDLEVPKGAFCVLSGPSGSGKSTMLNLMGGLDRPDAGTVEVYGTDLGSLSERELAEFRNRHLGFVFQSFHLLPVLTAAENVAWPLYLQGVPARERKRISRELLALVGLSEQAHRPPSRLSGGQQQRVAIARAMAGKPQLILADEPTANLDRRTAAEVIDLLERLNRERKVTLVIATHDPMVVERARMRVDFIGGGRIAIRDREGGRGHA